ncbi:MAG: phosphoglycerate kinase [Candidatus Woesearchaeota archaeon]
MQFNTLKDLDFKNKVVLVRVDFNVPIDKKGNISDDRRIKEAIPTIQYLIKKKAVVILMSHLGRPDGKVVEELRMDKIAERISKLMKKQVIKLDDCIGADVEDEISKFVAGEICMLENLRFHQEEEANDPVFAQGLASFADIYVNDAFGTMHRAHASVSGVPQYLPSCAGFLVQKEMELLDKARKPKKPFLVILSGAKADKIDLIKAMLPKANHIFLGGVLGNIALQAKGIPVGKSKTDLAAIKEAKKFIKNKKIILPEDALVADKINEKAKTKTVSIGAVPKDQIIVDIGPKTIKKIQELIKKSKTIFWAGPPGISEIKKFNKGTKAIAQAMAKSKAITIVGGGDSADAVAKFKLEKKFTHISTGGGAAIAYVEGRELPGITALIESKKRFNKYGK